jgi:hypothetical protein
LFAENGGLNTFEENAMFKEFIAGFAGALLTLGALGAPAYAADVVISGFVDTSLYVEQASDTTTFGLDQFEIDIEKAIEGVGGVRLDFNATPYSETFDDLMEQGYVWADMGPVTLTMGKFNAPIGFELLDPVDMWQYSYAYVFVYGVPTNVVGVMASGDAGMVDYAVYVVNGWDLNGDDNSDKTFGGRIGLTPAEGYNVGVSYITGNEMVGEVDTAKLTVIDIDATLEPVDGLTIGAEYNMGTFEGQSLAHPGDDSTWTAYLVMVNYAFTDSMALTLRYDSFIDTEGERLGSGQEETIQSFTVSPSYSIYEGFLILAEFRMTQSSLEVYTDADGAPTDTLSEFAIEATYSF